MSHHHEHGHHHHHHTEEEIPFIQKMEKLLDHWIKHNLDHAKSYRDWKVKAEKESLTGLAEVLEEAAQATTQLNEKLEKALQELS